MGILMIHNHHYVVLAPILSQIARRVKLAQSAKSILTIRTASLENKKKKSTEVLSLGPRR